MQQLGANYARDLYRVTLHNIVDSGDRVDTRGTSTLEVLNFCTEIWEPWHHCILVPSRRWNPWLALSEALWILAGRNDVESLKPFNQNISDYSDNGTTLYGAYGARMASQIDDVITRLNQDSNDRRAVLQIWDNLGARNDLWAKSKDPPCNNLVYFKLRKSQLHMTVMCRSNDLHFGLYAVNIPTFGLLQEYIAARLGVGMGYQTHLSNSLHVYTGDAQPGPRAQVITDRMLKDDAPLPTYPVHATAFTPKDFVNIKSHDEMKYMCSSVLEGVNNPVIGFPPFLMFAYDFLKAYKTKAWEPSKLRYADDYADWVAAGQSFVNLVWK